MMVRKTKGKIERLINQFSQPAPTTVKVKPTRGISYAKTLKQRFDTGEPIQLSISGDYQSAPSRSFSLDSADLVSSFGSTKQSALTSNGTQSRQHQNKTSNATTEVKETKTPLRQKVRNDFVDFEEETEEELIEDSLLEDDLEDLIKGGLKNDETNEKRKPSQTQKNEPEEELSIFDKMEKAQSMTYDLGTAQLSSSFQEFDDQLDLEEIEREERATRNKSKQQSIFSEVDDIEDIEHEVIKEEQEEQITHAQSIPNIGGTLFNLKGEEICQSIEEGNEAIIVINTQLARKLKNIKIQAIRKKNAPPPVSLSNIKREDYFILPPLTHRESIKEILKADDTNGFQEFGGRGLIPVDDEGNILYDKLNHLRLKDGKPAQPNDEAATIKLGILHKDELEILDQKFPYGHYIIDYTWHSHPGGEWVLDEKSNTWITEKEYSYKKLKESGNKITINESATTKPFNYGPSIDDIKYAHDSYKNTASLNEAIEVKNVPPLRDNFVIHKKEEEVFYFNNRTEKKQGKYTAKFDLNDFYELTGTKH